MDKVTVPEGRSGDWVVQKFTVTKGDEKWERYYALLHSHRRFVPEGTYTRLLHNGQLIMSDTPQELRDHLVMYGKAHGRILINGLGLGVILQACLQKEEVAHATVIEISEDVISLVGPHYEKMFGDRVEIIQADAMTWKPPKGIRYRAVWHDIWPEIYPENLEEMKILHRRYGRITDWQGSWCRHLCERG
ncbi:MAG: hypothetical protein PHC68_17635 [Syntrophorhabdaceae bacterium]|nr:hypothetical protein [Syntrophorhabdaceae bacterium]